MIYLSFKNCGSSLFEQRSATKELASDLLTSLGYPPSSLQKNGKGRPYLHSEDADVSVSHSGEICAAAVLTERYADGNFSLVVPSIGDQIGIDIEEVPSNGDINRYKRLARRFLNTDVDSTEGFFRQWTRKEAYGKMVGDGLFSESGIPCQFFTFTVETDNKRYILTISVKQRMP